MGTSDVRREGAGCTARTRYARCRVSRQLCDIMIRLCDLVAPPPPTLLAQATPTGAPVWPSNTYRGPCMAKQHLQGPLYGQATVRVGSVHFRTVDFGGAFFNGPNCVSCVLRDTHVLRWPAFIFCVKEADWGVMACVACSAPSFFGIVRHVFPRVPRTAQRVSNAVVEATEGVGSVSFWSSLACQRTIALLCVRTADTWWNNRFGVKKKFLVIYRCLDEGVGGGGGCHTNARFQAFLPIPTGPRLLLPSPAQLLRSSVGPGVAGSAGVGVRHEMVASHIVTPPCGPFPLCSGDCPTCGARDATQDPRQHPLQSPRVPGRDTTVHVGHRHAGAALPTAASPAPPATYPSARRPLLRRCCVVPRGLCCDPRWRRCVRDGPGWALLWRWGGGVDSSLGALAGTMAVSQNAPFDNGLVILRGGRRARGVRGGTPRRWRTPGLW